VIAAGSLATRGLNFGIDFKGGSQITFSTPTPRLVDDVRRIVEAQKKFFGGLPYRHYTFILHLAHGRGGLEHRNSAVFLVDRWGFRPAAAYERFLELISHEFFHVWNVKRVRPKPLGPFDYRTENHTRQLWTMDRCRSYE